MMLLTNDQTRPHDHVVFYCYCGRKVATCPCKELEGKEVVRFRECTHAGSKRSRDYKRAQEGKRKENPESDTTT